MRKRRSVSIEFDFSPLRFSNRVDDCLRSVLHLFFVCVCELWKSTLWILICANSSLSHKTNAPDTTKAKSRFFSLSSVTRERVFTQDCSYRAFTLSRFIFSTRHATKCYPIGFASQWEYDNVQIYSVKVRRSLLPALQWRIRCLFVNLDHATSAAVC